MQITKLFNSAFLLWVGLVRAYLVTPPGLDSTVDCTEWVQQSYSLTCAIIKDFTDWLLLSSKRRRVVYLVELFAGLQRVAQMSISSREKYCDLHPGK